MGGSPFSLPRFRFSGRPRRGIRPPLVAGFEIVVGYRCRAALCMVLPKFPGQDGPTGNEWTSGIVSVKSVQGETTTLRSPIPSENHREGASTLPGTTEQESEHWKRCSSSRFLRYSNSPLSWRSSRRCRLLLRSLVPLAIAYAKKIRERKSAGIAVRVVRRVNAAANIRDFFRRNSRPVDDLCPRKLGNCENPGGATTSSLHNRCVVQTDRVELEIDKLPRFCFPPELYKLLCNRPSEEENRHRWQSTTH